MDEDGADPESNSLSPSDVHLDLDALTNEAQQDDYGDPVKRELAAMPWREVAAIAEDGSDPRHAAAAELLGEVTVQFQGIGRSFAGEVASSWSGLGRAFDVQRLAMFNTSTLGKVIAETQRTALGDWTGLWRDKVTRSFTDSAHNIGLSKLITSSFAGTAQERLTAGALFSFQAALQGSSGGYAPTVSKWTAQLVNNLEPPEWEDLASSVEAAAEGNLDEPSDPESLQVVQNVTVYLQGEDKRSRLTDALVWAIAAYGCVLIDRTVPERDALLRHLAAVLYVLQRVSRELF